VAGTGPATGLVQIIRISGTHRARAARSTTRNVEVKVWDSSSEMRYLVLPERPPYTEGMSEVELAALVTRDSMIGAARVRGPKG